MQRRCTASPNAPVVEALGQLQLGQAAVAAIAVQEQIESGEPLGTSHDASTGAGASNGAASD